MDKICANCLWWSANYEKPEKAEGYYPCWNPLIARDMGGNESCEHFMGADATEVNVPNHCPNGIMTDPNPNPVDGPCEIMIVTYSKDLPWLVYALRCILKYCSGFQGVTVVHPMHELQQFANALATNEIALPKRKDGRCFVLLSQFDEVPGKGMLHHMVKMAEADLIVPPGTKYVLHTDADGMFKMPTTPEHYFWNDKPYYLIRSWASLGVPDPRHPISKAVSDCAQWKGPTDTQLGWDTEWYTMAMNTAVMPIDFYKPYRDHIAAVHKRPFDDHMLAGRNEFPQTSMDWTAMGAWAHRFMHDRFTWFNCENPVINPYPADRKKAYHSHTGYNWDETRGPIGFTPEIRDEIEGFLSQ